MNAEAKTQPQISPDKLTKVYRKIADQRDALRREYDEQIKSLEEKMDIVRDALLEYCKHNDLQSLRTNSGTVIVRKSTKYWTSDWESMYEFISKHNVPELLTRRLHQSAVKEWIETHPDDIPKGLNADTERTITIRKPTKKQQEEQ